MALKNNHMTKKAKIAVLLVLIALAAVLWLVLKNHSDLGTTGDGSGADQNSVSSMTADPDEEAETEVEKPKIDRTEMENDYRTGLKEKLSAFLADEAFAPERFQEELMAMTVPAQYRDLHWSLVSLVKDAGPDDRDPVAEKIGQLAADYPWLTTP